MKERPIIFSAPMVHAILEGRKTQTRRIIKESFNGCFTNGGPHPCPNEPILMYPGEIIPGPMPGQPDIVLDNESVEAIFHCSTLDSVAKCPYGAKGDRLWVRESHAENLGIGWLYKADATEDDSGERDGWWVGDEFFQNVKWKPSIHMPRKASRITLEVLDIRVERLQDISEKDAKAEGMFFTDYGRQCYHGGGPPKDVGNCPAPEHTHTQRPGWFWKKTERHTQCLLTARSAFGNIWQSIHGPDSWNQNPWVWVVEFKRVVHL